MIANIRLAKAAAVIARMALLVFALAAIAGPAPAEQKKTPPQKQQQKQQPQDPAEPSPAAMKMAREILNLKNSGALFEPMVPGVIERVKGMHMQTNPNLKKDLDEVAVQLRKVYAPRAEELMTDISWLYAARFTEAELKEILAFYRTPTGKKVIELEPLVFEDAMAGLKGWQEKFAEEVIARFRIEMKKRGHDL